MKRILSLALCMAMLLSLIPMTVSASSAEDADPDLFASITTTNVVRYTPDKETYKPGETIYIKASMDSIWGDPDLVGHIPGYEDELPGAYGMSVLTACVVFGCWNADNYCDPFTPLATQDHHSTSTILNMSSSNTTVGKSTLSDAKRNGWMNWFAASPSFTEDEDAYGMFNGSGDLCTFRLKVNEDATPGTYYIPVGPYAAIVLENDDKITFGTIHMNYFGVCNSFNDDVDPEFVTAVTNTDYKDPVHANNPYEGSYVKVVIEGDYTEEDTAAAAAVDELITNIGDVKYNAGNADGIHFDIGTDAGAYLHIGAVEGSNFTVDFNMIPISGGDDYSYLGGCTDASGDNPKLFWNNAEKKFQIARTDNWMNSKAVTEVLAESEVMDLPTNAYTHVQYVYNGNNLSIKVDGKTVCSWTGSLNYNFYIFYPSQVNVLMSDLVFAGDDFDTVTYKGYTEWHANMSSTWGTQGVMDSDALITAAEEAYDALTSTQKTLVTNYATLTAARAAYDELVADRDAIEANLVIEEINAIGTVNYNPFNADKDSGAKIAAAEAAYADLTAAQKALVTNYETLTTARTTYDNLIVTWDKAKAAEVDELIDAIGENITFDSRDVIETAEEAYAALTDAQKAYVTKYDTLLAARATYDQYMPVLNVENLIDAIGLIKYQGTVTHFDYVSAYDKGYYNFVDRDGGSCKWGLTLTFDFMYAAYSDNSYASNIGFIRNGASFAGYDFKTKSFVIGDGGGFNNSNFGVNNFVAQKQYDLVAGTWYNMTIEYVEGSAMARVYLNGELMVEGNTHDSNYGYAIFYPQQVDMYIGENHLTYGATYPYPFTESPFEAGRYGDLNTYDPDALVDVDYPLSINDKITAAEEAYAALDEDQQALLSDAYKTTLANARTAYDAKHAEIIANAAATVEAIDGMLAGTVTADAANASYNALTPSAKALVTNADELKKANSVNAINLIDAIGDVTYESGDAIAAAEKAYNALADDEKAFVTNYETLTAARAAYDAGVATVNDAVAAINKLYTFLKQTCVEKDNGDGNTYSQFLDIKGNLSESNDVAPYSASFDVYVESVDTDNATCFFGGSTANGIFLAYNFKTERFVISSDASLFDGRVEAFGTVYASADYTIELGKWYNVEFVLGDNYAEILVDGESVVKYEGVQAKGWFIYYPRACTCYYDNYEFTYDGEVQEVAPSITGVGTTTWTAMYAGGFAPVVSTDLNRFNIDSLDDANAVYAAVSDAFAGAVSNVYLLDRANAITVATKNDAVITNVQVTPGEEEITVTWDAVDNAWRYWVFVDGECRVGIDPSEDTVATIKVPTGEHTVEVALEVYLKDGEDGDFARYYVGKMDEVIEVTVDAAVLPCAKDVQVTSGVEELTVTWTPADGVTTYWVFVDGNCKKRVDDAATATLKVAAGEHTITVASQANHDGIWEIVHSEAVTAIANEYALPTAQNVALTDAGDGKVTVTWDAIDGVENYWVFVNGACRVRVTSASELSAIVNANAGDEIIVAAQVYRADLNRWYVTHSDSVLVG